MCTTDFIKFRKNISDFMETQHSCCSAKLGSFIFAMINCIITALASIFSTVWLISHVIWYFVIGNSRHGTLVTDLLVTGIAAGTMVISFASFGFGVALVKGILEKRHVLIRAYFIYGVMVVSVCIATAISLSASARGFDVYVTCALIILGACVLYSGILAMIWVAYRKFQLESQYDQRYFYRRRPITSL